MKVRLCAIGKSKAGPEQHLFEGYAKRLPWKLDCKEFDIKNPNPDIRKAKEGEALLEAASGYGCMVALDESGKSLSSREFSQWFGKAQQQASSFAFIIGGSDGLDERIIQKSQLVWSLGRVTWPHMLVRALVAEQLYRAHCLLTGHPYHRD